MTDDRSQTTFYAVGYSRPRGVGFDIGEFDTFREAVEAAVLYGATAPDQAVVDCAGMVFKIDDSPGDTVWIQRFGVNVSSALGPSLDV